MKDSRKRDPKEKEIEEGSDCIGMKAAMKNREEYTGSKEVILPLCTQSIFSGQVTITTIAGGHARPRMSEREPRLGTQVPKQDHSSKHHVIIPASTSHTPNLRTAAGRGWVCFTLNLEGGVSGRLMFRSSQPKYLRPIGCGVV